MIVEVATVTRKDGTESRFGRERGRKMFVALDPAGGLDRSGLGYSWRTLNERPQRDRNVTGVRYEKCSVA